MVNRFLRKYKLFYLIFFPLLIIIVSLLHLLPADSQAQSPTNNHYTERIIVKYRAGLPRMVHRFYNDRLGLTKLEDIGNSGAYVFEIPPGEFYPTRSRLLKNVFIEYIEPDYDVTMAELPNDPEFPNQWGLTMIEAPLAWDKTHGTGSVRVAIVDTGVAQAHPDVSGKVTVWGNFTNENQYDRNGHGTHVAGITAAFTNNALGVAGTGYETGLISAKVLNYRGTGYVSWVAGGVRWSADQGANIINMSLSTTSFSLTLQEAVVYAQNKGVLVVAAAGNNSGTNPVYPAGYADVLAVAATNSQDAKAGFSNYGSSWVDLAAPGDNILSTYGYSNYRYLSGTSMASPFVAGAAALVKASDPGLTSNQLTQILCQTADDIPGTGNLWACGRLNLNRALSEISPGPTATPTPTLAPTVSPTPVITPTPTLTPIPSATPTPTSAPTPSATPVPTSTPEPTPTPEISCTVNLIPATAYVRRWSSQTLTATINTTNPVHRVEFSSSNTTIASVNPNVDYSAPFETQVRGISRNFFQPAIITAQVFLAGQSSPSCSTNASVFVVF